MVNFTSEQIRELMEDTPKVRIVGIYGHGGKQTLNDCLIDAAFVQKNDSTVCERVPISSETSWRDVHNDPPLPYWDPSQDRFQFAMPEVGDDQSSRRPRAEEEEGSSSTKALPVDDDKPLKKLVPCDPPWTSLFYHLRSSSSDSLYGFTEEDERNNDYFIQLIRSAKEKDLTWPAGTNHLTFDHDLAIADGGIVVLDMVEGWGPFFENWTVPQIRELLKHRVNPVFLFNKVDRLFLELCSPAEDIYLSFVRMIDNIERVIFQFGLEEEEYLSGATAGAHSGTAGFRPIRRKPPLLSEWLHPDTVAEHAVSDVSTEATKQRYWDVVASLRCAVQSDSHLKSASTPTAGSESNPAIVGGETERSTPDLISYDLTCHIAKFMVAVTPSQSVDTNMVDPRLGTISFGSAKQGWGFTLPEFGKIYGRKFGVDIKKMTDRLWGESHFDPKAKCWMKSNLGKDGKTPLKRAFCQFILEPIQRLVEVISNSGKPGAEGEKGKEQLQSLLQRIGVQLSEADLNQTAASSTRNVVGEKFALIMRKWLSLSESILSMVVLHVPSPKQAVKYRADVLLNKRSRAESLSESSGEPIDEISLHLRTSEGTNGCFRTFSMLTRLVGESWIIPRPPKRRNTTEASTTGGKKFLLGRVLSGSIQRRPPRPKNITVRQPDHYSSNNWLSHLHQISLNPRTSLTYPDPIESIPAGCLCLVALPPPADVKKGDTTTTPSTVEDHETFPKFLIGNPLEV